MTDTQAIATRPLCVGRFLIDVPVESTVTGTLTTSAGVSGTISVQTGVSKSAFNLKMAGIEARLRSAVHETEGSRLSEVLRPDETTYIFRYRKSEIGTRVYQIDGYRWADSTMFAIVSGSSNDEFRSVVDDVAKGLLEIKPRDTWTIPTELGFCFDGGFLPGGDGGFEATGVQLTFKAYPGLMIALETQTNEQGVFAGPDLIARTEQGQGILDPGQRAMMVRKDARKSVSGRTGQEVMMKRQIDGALRLVGYLQIDAEPGRTDAPSIAFSLGLTPSDNVADRVPADADAGVIELWDTITQSLRLRPGAV